MLRGGAYDEWRGEVDLDDQPRPVLIAWSCGKRCGLYQGEDCAGHASFNAHDPAIVLKTAESYELVLLETVEGRATYTVGADEPELAEGRELMLVGVVSA